MKKGTIIFKKKIASFLVVLMCINTMGAVVSDNDGSAFITKAEFDSLKNDFQSQIDQYNTSIDSKIDGAIANYLAGISIAKKEQKKILVSNYDQMRWINTFKVYGSYKKWSSYDTYVEQTNKWFKPAIGEKRSNLRNGTFGINDVLDMAIGLSSLYAKVSVNDLSNGCLLQRGSNVGYNGYPQTPPVLCLEMKRVEDDWFINFDHPFYNSFAFAYQLYTLPHRRVSFSGLADWRFMGNALYFVEGMEPIVVQPLDTGEIFKYDLRIANDYGHNTLDGSTAVLQYTINTDNALFPIAYAEKYAYDDCGYGSSTKAVGTDNSSGLPDALSKGMTWTKLTNTKQNTLLKYMMFGTDDNIVANLCKPVRNTAEGRSFDMSGSDSSSVLTGTISEVNIDTFARSRANTSSYYQNKAADISVTLQIPHWPQEKISNLSTGQFKYNKTYLQAGQGLPLVNDIAKSGYMQVTFDYDVKYILDEQSKNKQILVSIKKDDFNTTNNQYFDGYLDIVDPDSTTLQVYTLNNKTYENAEGKCKLTIPVNKDDNMWLRVAPQNDTGGYYATINNLNITYVTE